MFRRYRIWRAEKALVEARLTFSQFGQESGEAQRDIIQKIIYAKRRSDKDWSSATKDAEVEQYFYELLLHQQWMGYLAETVRQKTNELYGLKNNISGLLLFAANKTQKLWAAGEDMGSRPANNSQKVIYREFLISTLPRVEHVEAEMFRCMQE